MMEYTAVVTTDGRREVAEFPDCPGCQTFAEPGEDLYATAAEALEGWLEAHLAGGDVPPRPRAHRRAPKGARLVPVRVAPALAARLELRWAREAAGLTQQALAERVGVSQQAIAKLESPDANLRLDTLERVACALGLDVDLALVPPHWPVTAVRR